MRSWRLSWLRIALDHDRPIGPLDADTPPSRPEAGLRRVASDLVDVKTTSLAGLKRDHELLEIFDIDDGAGSAFAESEHRKPRVGMPRPIDILVKSAAASGVK
jgi:hypothetical protein